MSRWHKLAKAAIVAAALIALAGCNDRQFIVNAIAKKPPALSAWLVYWDLPAGEKELKALGNRLETIADFGAYFDAGDHLFIPAELTDNSKRRNRQAGKTYLTFVNDKQNPDGSISLKDTDVLSRLFADDAAMETHIDAILALTRQHGYDGIEIDYERIWKNESIRQSFVRFINKLYVKALKSQLALRIILEPGTPFAAAGFANGPEYVVMFYNLYGLHSSAGPKANAEFIRKTASRMKDLPGDKAAAFANGGCLWGDNGEKRFLTEVEAKTLAALHDARPQRDADSQGLSFSYQEGGVSYQVWYADAKTLRFWIKIAQDQGINRIFLWRLGGNIDIHKVR